MNGAQHVVLPVNFGEAYEAGRFDVNTLLHRNHHLAEHLLRIPLALLNGAAGVVEGFKC